MPGPKPKYPIALNQEQGEPWTHLSLSDTAPSSRVQRAKARLLASQHPHWGTTQRGKEGGWCRQTLREWRREGCQEGNLEDRDRSGAPRRFSSLARAQIVAVACTNPAEQGKVWKRGSGEKLARVAVAKEMVECMSPSTVRCWLSKDKIKPWRYHAWQKPTAPQVVQKATAVLDLYEQAQELATQGEMVCAADEKTSIQARKRLSHTQPAMSGHPVHISDRYERKGALQLCCALAVATGMTFSLCLAKKGVADVQAFLMGLFASALCQGIRVLHLVLDHGPTHAPTQLGGWIASVSLSCEVRIYWLPKHASWLDHVEIIFSKVQRDVPTPNDFPSTLALERALMSSLEELNSYPKPIQWTYTSAKLVAKFGEPG